MLHAHPRVFSHGEVYLRYGRETAGRRWRPDPLRYLERDMRKAGRRHYVFSLHFLRGQHLRPDLVGLGLGAFLDAARSRGIERVALLERRNALRVILSKYAGERREIWHLRPGDEAPLTQFALDPRSVDFAGIRMPLVAWLEEFERSYGEARARVAERGGTFLTYEDDVLPDPRIGYRRLCAALGVAALPVDVPLRRATPFPVAALVSNVEAIARELRGTPYAWMLEAD